MSPGAFPALEKELFANIVSSEFYCGLLAIDLWGWVVSFLAGLAAGSFPWLC